MLKVYLLLRDNQQSGPFSLEELSNKGLKEHDLIWVEGKSAGWRFPSEIDSLKSIIAPSSLTISPAERTSLPELKTPGEKKQSENKAFQVKGKHIYVSFPGKLTATDKQPSVEAKDPIEKKAEELFQKVQAFTQSRDQHPAGQTEGTKYARSLAEMEEQYTNWLYEKKKKKRFSLKQKRVAGIGVASIIIMGCGIYGAVHYFPKSQKINDTVAVKGIEQKSFLPKDITRENSSDQVNSGEVISNPDIAPVLNVATQKETYLKKNIVSKKETFPAVKRISVEDTQNSNPIAEKKTDDNSLATSIPENKPALQNQDPVVKNDEVTKKSGLGKTLSNIFSGFKKKKAEVQEAKNQEVAPATQNTQQPVLGQKNERSSTKREGMEEKPQSSIAGKNPSELSSKIELKTNQRTEDWMMGINGLKLSLINHNNVLIKTASVDVLYYDEDNHFLERKTMYFSNIPAKGSLTLTAPAQRTADHIEYRLSSITTL